MASEIGIPVHTEDVAFFSVPPVNVAQEKITYVEHLPTFGKGGKTAIQFHIAGTGDQYTDLSHSYLYAKIKILNKDGSIFKQDSSTSTAIPIDNVLHSLWSMADIKLNGNLISTSGTNYMYQSYIESLLNCNENAKNFQMSMVGFTGESGNFDGTNPDQLPYNTGLNTRYSWWKGIRTKYLQDPSGKPVLPPGADPNGEIDMDEVYNDPTCVEFVGPLMADICNQERLILNGVNIDIKLWPNRDEFRLITFPNGTEAEIEIETIVFLVCKVKLNPKLFVAIEEFIAETPALYPIQRTDIRTHDLTAGSYGTTLEDIFQGDVPTRLVIGMVDARAKSGDFHLNPYHFNHFNIASAGFYVDGEPTPRVAYEFDFYDCNYLLGLHSLYSVAGKLNENTDIGITRTSYRQGNALIGFEVDPTTSANFSYIGKTKSGRTRLQIRFHKALSKNITIIIYATFPEIIQIDKARNVCMRDRERSLSRIRGEPILCAPSKAPRIQLYS